MSSTAHLARSTPMTPKPMRLLDGHRAMMRGAQGILGAALLMAAFGLWLAPGANWSQGLMLMKLLASSVAVMLGLACLQGLARPALPRVEVDTIRQEVRLVRTHGKDRKVLDRCKFADLTLVEKGDTHVQLWRKTKTVIAEVAVSDRVTHRRLVRALRVAGQT